MRSVKLIAILCGGALVSFAQEYSKQDVSVQALGSFVKSTWNNGIEQTATNSGGVLASYRYFLQQKQRRRDQLRLHDQHAELRRSRH